MQLTRITTLTATTLTLFATALTAQDSRPTSQGSKSPAAESKPAAEMISEQDALELIQLSGAVRDGETMLKEIEKRVAQLPLPPEALEQFRTAFGAEAVTAKIVAIYRERMPKNAAKGAIEFLSSDAGKAHGKAEQAVAEATQAAAATQMQQFMLQAMGGEEIPAVEAPSPESGSVDALALDVMKATRLAGMIQTDLHFGLDMVADSGQVPGTAIDAVKKALSEERLLSMSLDKMLDEADEENLKATITFARSPAGKAYYATLLNIYPDASEVAQTAAVNAMTQLSAAMGGGGR